MSFITEKTASEISATHLYYKMTLNFLVLPCIHSLKKCSILSLPRRVTKSSPLAYINHYQNITELYISYTRMCDNIIFTNGNITQPQRETLL